MTIGKGQEWGSVVACPDDLVIVDDDAALHRLVQSCRDEGRSIPALGLRGGDLFRAVGGVEGVDRLAPGAEVARLPCDLVRVTLDGSRTHWAASHVVAVRPVLGSLRLGWWRGQLLAWMNGEFLGAWDVAPRGHPNDGRVDVVSVTPDMGVGDRWKARRRLVLGTHVPHPAISIRSVRSGEWSLAPGTQVRVDGVGVGTTSVLAVEVEPDAFTVHV